MAGSRPGRIATWRIALAAQVVAGALCLLTLCVLAAAQAPGSPRSQCIKAALVMPKIKHAYIAHPGKRPYENDPHVVGPIQSIHVRVDYPEAAPKAQPGGCDEVVLRVEHGEVQKKIGSKWRRIPDASWRHAGNDKRIERVEHYDSVHGEPEWMYWHPGDRYRVFMKNAAKNARTRKVLGFATKTVRVKIRRHGRNPRASASSRTPRLSWTLPHTANEGQRIAFSWNAAGHLGRRHRLVVQRQVGTARSWKSVLRLRGRSGSTELSGLPLGRYRLRLADLVWRGRVLAKQVSGLGVFGQVPFTTLFGTPRTRVYTTKTVTFSYVRSFESYENPAFTVEDNHCRSVHIAFVSGAGYGGKSSSMTLVQESRDPVSVTTETDELASLDAELVPGQSWSVNLATPGSESVFYVNGYAVCSSSASFGA